MIQRKYGLEVTKQQKQILSSIRNLREYNKVRQQKQSSRIVRKRKRKRLPDIELTDPPKAKRAKHAYQSNAYLIPTLPMTSKNVEKRANHNKHMKPKNIRKARKKPTTATTTTKTTTTTNTTKTTKGKRKKSDKREIDESDDDDDDEDDDPTYDPKNDR